MTRKDAEEQAKAEAKRIGLPLAIVREGPHADDFAEFDADGHSYGYCPVAAVPVLYKHGEKVGEVKP